MLPCGQLWTMCFCTCHFDGPNTMFGAVKRTEKMVLGLECRPACGMPAVTSLWPGLLLRGPSAHQQPRVPIIASSFLLGPKEVIILKKYWHEWLRQINPFHNQTEILRSPTCF